MVRCGVALAFLASVAAFAFAETAVSETAKAMVGAWEISDAARERRCAVTFSVDPAPGGLKLAFDPKCPTVFRSLEAVVAWALGPKDAVRLIDAAGATVLEFTEVESGMYESDRRAEGLLFLQTQAALKVDARTAAQIFGNWQLVREAGKPLCRLTLSNAPADDGAYKVVVRPGCTAVIAGIGLAVWRLDRDQLVLIGRGGMWRFSESDAETWERVPLSTNPLLLTRE